MARTEARKPLPTGSSEGLSSEGSGAAAAAAEADGAGKGTWPPLSRSPCFCPRLLRDRGAAAGPAVPAAATTAPLGPRRTGRLWSCRLEQDTARHCARTAAAGATIAALEGRSAFAYYLRPYCRRQELLGEGRWKRVAYEAGGDD
mmetsp:Transcript_26947/g.67879  ORF Transcript_26947/g.67879 Transcript_26947/m.67879 type:complete len:145 (-) Transcript_26947:31-465(-)